MYFLATVLLLFLSCTECILQLQQRCPEESMTTPEIIAYHGYPVEILTTTTPDGYKLELHRIPFGKNETLLGSINKKKPVVFLQHGLLASSADWVANLPHQSLGFILADMGFDVWLGNVRGNFYSRRHAEFETDSEDYWNFTWDEMTKYDIGTMIDRALQVSKQDSLYYIGHSQGTMIMFTKLASDPSFSKKIRHFFALAPVATVGHIEGLLKIIGEKFIKEFEWLMKMTGRNEFLPSNWFSKFVSRLICGTLEVMNPLCRNVLFQIGGPEGNQFNKSRLMVYMSHTPAGTSTANILHWAQMERSGKTQMFDYGSAEKNMAKYGQTTPPLYDLKKICAPTSLYYSDKDWLADTIDIEENLLREMPKEFQAKVVKLMDFNHFDFIYGLNAPRNIYDDVVAAINGDLMTRNNKIDF